MKALKSAKFAICSGADLKYVKQVARRSEIFKNNIILCVMYKAMLRGVLCANKCKIIKFPWNKNNVDQSFQYLRLRNAIRQSQEDFQAYRSLQPSCRLAKGSAQIYADPCAGWVPESHDILTKSGVSCFWLTCQLIQRLWFVDFSIFMMDDWPSGWNVILHDTRLLFEYHRLASATLFC